MDKNYSEINRILWDEWTQVNLAAQSDYQAELAQFSQGGSTLPEIVRKEVGDVAGKSLLHLMCHFGLDTLSWARQGAAVTGVDFSAQAIAKAQSLSAEFSIPAEFIHADIYQLEQILSRKFDIVFTSTGVLIWLPNLNRWAQVVANHLKPGGVFYIHEGHPFHRLLFPERLNAAGKLAQVGYFAQSGPVIFPEHGSYAYPNAGSVHTACYWPHSMGEIVSALCENGLRLQFLHEFPKVLETGRFYVRQPDGQLAAHNSQDMLIPQSFSIRATV